MPIEYDSRLWEWSEAPRLSIPSSKSDKLSLVTNPVDEKFRVLGKQQYHYSDVISNYSTGVVTQSLQRLVEAARSFEYMWGFNHPSWRYHNLQPGIDVGGPWQKLDVTIEVLGQEVECHRRVLTNTYQDFHGLLCASVEVPPLAGHLQGTVRNDLSWIRGVAPTLLTDNSLDAYGATAIARVEPTNPAADLSQALGELYRDGVPSLPGRQDGNIGSEYLNLQFGWSPTISDGQDFIDSIRHYGQISDQFVRDSGRLIRRRYEFPIETSNVVSVTTSSPPSNVIGGLIPNGNLIQLGTLTKTVKTVSRKWFSGAFTYYLPANVFLRNIAVLDKAFGIVPGVDTAWALTPWSWLLDWFSNASDVIHNLNAFVGGGLVMPWGYVMSDTTVRTEYSLATARKVEIDWVPLTLTSVVYKRTRQRRRANPFGFGLTWDGLSSFQLSILAALGMSRGRLAW